MIYIKKSRRSRSPPSSTPTLPRQDVRVHSDLLEEGIRLHNLRHPTSSDGNRSGKYQSDHLAENDEVKLESLHYPRGRYYTPEIDRLRQNQDRRNRSRSVCSFVAEETDDANLQGQVTIPEPENFDEVPNADEKEGEEQTEGRCEKRCLGYFSAIEYPMSLDLTDLEHQANLFLKIMILRGIQMLAGFGFTIYVQVGWGKDRVSPQPTLVKIAYDFPWILYVAGALYLLLHLIIRLTRLGTSRCFSFIIYLLKMVAIMAMVFILGIRWQLTSASVATLSLGVNSFLTGLLPQLKEDMDIAKGECLVYVFSFVDVLILFFGLWFLISAMLANYSSVLSLTYSHDDIFLQLFLHCLPTFVVSACVAGLDLRDVRRMFKGRRFPMSRKSWVRAAASL